jgi:hypothetical protein
MQKQHSFVKQWGDGLRFRIDARIFILMIWMEVVDDALYQSTSSNYFHGKHDIKMPLGLMAHPWPRMKFWP